MAPISLESVLLVYTHGILKMLWLHIFYNYNCGDVYIANLSTV